MSRRWRSKNGIEVLQVLGGRCNVYLLSEGEHTMLVDTGTKRYCKALEKALRKLDIRHLDYLLLTHTHFDHAGNARKIQQKYNASVIVHRSERELLASGKATLPEGTLLITRLLSYIGKKLAFRFDFEPCRADISVDTILDCGDMGFNAYIIHTPGHSEGSLSLVADEEIVIAGDTIFGVVRNNIYPPFADNPAMLKKSWEKLLNTNGSIFLPAHGSKRNRKTIEKVYAKKYQK